MEQRDGVLPAREFRRGDADIHAELFQVLRKAEISCLAIPVCYKGSRETPPVINGDCTQLLS